MKLAAVALLAIIGQARGQAQACTAVDTPDGCSAQDCTAVDTPYVGCTVPACIGVDTPYAGCIVPACTDVDTPYVGCTAQECTAVDTPYAGCSVPACTGVDTPYAGCMEIICEQYDVSYPVGIIGYEVSVGNASTASTLGVTCGAGYSGSAVAECAVPGGAFNLTGCEENVCDNFTISHGHLLSSELRGYRFENLSATTARALGASCVDGFYGSAEVACDDAVGGHLAVSGCYENECVVPFDVGQLGYVVSLPNATRVTELGQLSCATGYSPPACILTPGTDCSIDGDCVYTAPFAGQEEVAESCLAGNASCTCVFADGQLCSINATLLAAASPEGCTAVPHEDPATEASSPTTCTLVPSVDVEIPSSCETSGAGLCQYFPAVAAVTEESLCADAGCSCEVCTLTPGINCSQETIGCMYTAPVGHAASVAEACTPASISAACTSHLGLFSFEGCVENACEAPGTNPVGYNLQWPSGITSTQLGKVSCASGYTLAESEYAPYASCSVPGGKFLYSGCVENFCTPLSPNITAGYSIENVTATTVLGLGAINCAFGYNGVPVVSCDVDNGSFAISGCEENSCDVASLGIGFIQGYQTKNAVRAGTSMTLTQLGAITCRDGFVGQPTANCTNGQFSVSGCLRRATCGTGMGSQLDADQKCNYAFLSGLLGGDACTPVCEGVASTLLASCSTVDGHLCSINATLLAAASPEGCTAVPHEDPATEASSPTTCTLVPSVDVEIPSSCETSGAGLCQYFPAVAAVTEESLCADAGCEYTQSATPTCDLDPATDGSAMCPAGCQTAECSPSGSAIYNTNSAAMMCEGTTCDLALRNDTQRCCIQSCLDFNCSALGKVAVDQAERIASDGLGTTCCQMRPCGRPVVSISTPSPLVIRRSTGTSVRASSSLEMCAVPEGAVLMYQWRCSDSSIELDLATLSKSELRLAPYSFPAGETVELTVTTWLSSSPDLNSTASMSLRVEQAEQVLAHLAGGRLRTVYRGASVILNGTKSTDPDEPGPTIWDTVQWTCQTVSGPNCSTASASDTLVWDLTATIATAAAGISEYTLTVAKNGRQANATVRVQVVDAPVPSVVIPDTAPKYSASNRIALAGLAIPVDPQHTHMTWSWTATENSLPFALTGRTSTPLTNPVLVLVANALTVGRSYSFRLQANDGRGTGSCEVAIVLNAGPTDGSVSVTPTSGQAIVDNFVIAAADWEDDDIPLLYTFGYIEASKEIVLTAATSSSTTTAILPAGPAEVPTGAEYAYEVTVAVADSYGAVATAASTVQVRPYAPALASDMLTDASELLGVASTSDNEEQSAQLVRAFAVSLNMPSVSPTTETPEEKAQRRTKAAEIRVLLANTLLNSITGSIDQDLGQMSSAVIDNEKVAFLAQSLASVSARDEEMTEESLERSLDAVALLSSSTPEVVSTAAVESMASAMSNLFVATSKGGTSAAFVNASQAAGYARKAVSIVQTLSKSLVSNSFVGEAPVAVETDAFDLSSQKDYASSLQGNNLTIAGSANVGIRVPSRAFDNTETGADAPLDVFVTAWVLNPFAFADEPALPGASSGESARQGTSVLSLDFGTGADTLELRDLPEPFVLRLAPPALSECERHGAYDWIVQDEAFDAALHASLDFLSSQGNGGESNFFLDTYLSMDEFIGVFEYDVSQLLRIDASQVVVGAVTAATVSFSVRPSAAGVSVHPSTLQQVFNVYPQVATYDTSNFVMDGSGLQRRDLPHTLQLSLPSNVTLFDMIVIAASSGTSRPRRMQVINTADNSEDVLCDWEHPQGSERSETCAGNGAADYFAYGSTSPCVGDTAMSFSECKFDQMVNYTQAGALSLRIVTVAENGAAGINSIFYVNTKCLSNAHRTIGAYCSYWDTKRERWVVDSKSGPGAIAADGIITCSFNHLTDFNAFLGPVRNMNAPCFSCISEFLRNPAGIIVVFVCAFLLISTLGISMSRYSRYSRRDPEDIERSRFAADRKAVMSPDAVHPTTWQHDVKHRLRYDYSLGGICCQLEGDPFDWSQRAVVFVTTLIISLMVSIMFFSTPEPDCRTECEPPKDEFGQFVDNEPVVCETVCVEPDKKGAYVSIVSALITTPLVFGLVSGFRWLRKPIVEVIEPDGFKLKQVINRVRKANKGMVSVVQTGAERMRQFSLGSISDDYCNEDERTLIDDGNTIGLTLGEPNVASLKGHLENASEGDNVKRAQGLLQHFVDESKGATKAHDVDGISIQASAAIKIQASCRGRQARAKYNKELLETPEHVATSRILASQQAQRQREKHRARLAESQRRACIAKDREARHMEEVTAVFRGQGALGLGIKASGGEVQVVSALSNSLRELYGGCQCSIKPPSASQPPAANKGKLNKWNAAKAVAADISYYTDIPCPCDLVGIVATGNGGKLIDVGHRRDGLDHDAVLDLLRSAKRPLQLVFEVAKPRSSRKKNDLSTGDWLEDAKRAVKEEEAREAERLKREEAERAAAKLADEHASRPLPVPRSKHHAALPLCTGFLLGFCGLVVIYGIAANLGAERTAQWLGAASLSLVINVLIMDPLKVAAMALFVHYAEILDSQVALPVWQNQ